MQHADFFSFFGLPICNFFYSIKYFSEMSIAIRLLRLRFAILLLLLVFLHLAVMKSLNPKNNININDNVNCNDRI